MAYRPHLAPRELTILKLMNLGLSDAQIAKRLNLTPGSASASVGRIRLKFGGGSRDDVVNLARTLDIVTIPRGATLKAVRIKLSAPPLTARDLDVLDLMSRGLSNGEIAERLDVTLSSANSYVTNIRTRIGGDTRFEVVQRARGLKLIKTPKSGGIKEIELTPFRQRVLELAAAHLTNTHIGRRLHRSLDAVTDALKYARGMLGVKTTAEAIDRAIDLGIIRIPKVKDAPNIFTDRECEILEGLFGGLMHREIAKDLGISIGTVGGRVQEMKSKMRARDTDELLDEVERLRLYTPSQPRKRLVARTTLSKRQPAAHGITALTERQIDVIEAFSRHPRSTIPEIARDLGLSPNTVSGHLRNIRHRIGVKKSSDIAEAAFALGLVRARPRAT